MLNARHSFARLWKRLVAALSLVMAAALAPAAVPTPAGAGAASSRVGSGATVASAANALAANGAGLIEGCQHQLPLGTSTDGAGAKACTLAPWQEIATPCCKAASLQPTTRAALQTHAARSGPTRAPPAA